MVLVAACGRVDSVAIVSCAVVGLLLLLAQIHTPSIYSL